MDHGPQLLQSVLERCVDEEDSLITARDRNIPSTSQVMSLQAFIRKKLLSQALLTF